MGQLCTWQLAKVLQRNPMNSMFHSAFTYFSGVHAPVVSNVTNQSPVDDDVDKAMLLSTITQMGTVWSITPDFQHYVRNPTQPQSRPFCSPANGPDLIIIILIIIIIIIRQFIRRRNMSMKSLCTRAPYTPGSRDERRTAPDGRRPLDQVHGLEPLARL